MKNKTVWANRLKGKTSLSFQKIGSSISADKRLYEQDIAASIVHTKMLVKQKIIGKRAATNVSQQTSEDRVLLCNDKNEDPEEVRYGENQRGRPEFRGQKRYH